MSEPYIMDWYPEDGRYASLAMYAFDTLSGTLDGFNSAGLVVSIMADEEVTLCYQEGLLEMVGGPRLSKYPVVRCLGRYHQFWGGAEPYWTAKPSS